MIIIYIALIIGAIALVIAYIGHRIFIADLLNEFDRSNTITFGKIGRGKGLTTQYVINHRKKPYYGNISYSKEGDKKFIRQLETLKEVSTDKNDYKNIVEGKIEATPHKFVEHSDIFIDDIGVYLPSYLDSIYRANYPYMKVDRRLYRL